MANRRKKSAGWTIVERCYQKERYKEVTRSIVFTTKRAAAGFVAALQPTREGGCLHVVPLHLSLKPRPGTPKLRYGRQPRG